MAEWARTMCSVNPSQVWCTVSRVPSGLFLPTAGRMAAAGVHSGAHQFNGHKAGKETLPGCAQKGCGYTIVSTLMHILCTAAACEFARLSFCKFAASQITQGRMRVSVSATAVAPTLCPCCAPSNCPGMLISFRIHVRLTPRLAEEDRNRGPQKRITTAADKRGDCVLLFCGWVLRQRLDESSCMQHLGQQAFQDVDAHRIADHVPEGALRDDVLPHQATWAHPLQDAHISVVQRPCQVRDVKPLAPSTCSRQAWTVSN